MTGKAERVEIRHMVLGRDLNPHDTLFAGQAASQMIECGFLAVQNFLQTGHIVCRSLDGMRFFRPVGKGDTTCVTGRVVYAGRTSVGAYIALTRGSDGQKAAECFVSFVHIEEESGRAVPHGRSLDGIDEEGTALQRLYLAYKEMKQS